MGSVQYVSLELTPPENGWLPLCFEFDDFIFECQASNLLNDPLNELLDLLENLQNSNFDGSRICLWLEPQGYAIDVFAAYDMNRCVVRISYHDSMFPPMEGRRMEREFECDCEIDLLKQALITAMSKLFNKSNSDVLFRWGRHANSERYSERLTSIRRNDDLR